MNGKKAKELRKISGFSKSKNKKVQQTEEYIQSKILYKSLKKNYNV